jgi:hypothetical protein
MRASFNADRVPAAVRIIGYTNPLNAKAYLLVSALGHRQTSNNWFEKK